MVNYQLNISLMGGAHSLIPDTSKRDHIVSIHRLALQSRKRVPVLVAPVLMLATLSCLACGGSGSLSHTTPGTSPGTPAGTYTATVTAISGGLTHTTAFNVTVH
jgi:hypothetical protein